MVGVSGGRDSVALLHFLVQHGWRNIIVAHFNHSLRGRESGQDAAFVRRLADSHGLSFATQKADIAAIAQQSGLSIEAAARRERDRFFEQLSLEKGARFVFLAHHLEDNAETVLGNLFRGAGHAGIAGMKAVSATAGSFLKVRPLLTVRRSEIDEYVAAHGLAFREDSSNASPEHRRNRIRNELLPLLDDVFQRDTAQTTARFAVLASRDEDCLQNLALSALRDYSLIQPDRSLRVVPELLGLHPAILSRVLRQWLLVVLELRGLGNVEIESALLMLRPGGPAKLNLPEARHLRRKAKRLWVE